MKNMVLYSFIGPEELLRYKGQTERSLIGAQEDVRMWAQRQPRGELVATFVVDERGRLWIADRRSEHIACARGGRVQAAGEIEFEVGGSRASVVGITNQSTGFCPRVGCWEALARVLDEAALIRPESWTTAFEFRRCGVCGELNVVKDGWLVCSSCDADLPSEWNIGNAQTL